MTWKLFLDDERNLPHCIANAGFTVARTVDEARRLTQERGYPCEIWFDHDLGIGAPGGDALNYMHWLASVIMDSGHDRAAVGIAVRVHSHNTVGAQNLVSYWQNFVYHFAGTEVTVPYTPYQITMAYNQ